MEGQPQIIVPTRFDQRIGDVERSAVCDHLAGAYAAGRLDEAEFEERLAAAMTARTRMESLLLVRDLAPVTAGRPVPPAPQPSWTGLDVWAAVALIGCLATVLGLLVIIGSISGPWFLVAVAGGSAAGVGGASATHLLHRHARLSASRLSGPDPRPGAAVVEQGPR